MSFRYAIRSSTAVSSEKRKLEPMPKSTHATIPPSHIPATPRRIVAHQGIGSGPGTASRARPPTTKPPTIR
jgi:hypothetical protein